MGCACGTTDAKPFYKRTHENFFVNHDKNSLMMQSHFESNLGTNYSHKLKQAHEEGSVDKLYDDVMSGKYDLSKSGCCTSVEVLSFDALFGIYYGTDSKKFKDYY